MHIKRVVLVLGAALGTCAVGAGTVGADVFGTLSNPKRLDIISKATGINNFVDVGPGGSSPGDLYVFSDDVFNASDPSRKIGQADGRCIMVDPATARFGCTIITSLPPGDIMTDGTLTLVPGTTSTGAVTGGTRDFRNARGEATLDLGPPEGPHTATFKLIVYP